MIEYLKVLKHSFRLNGRLTRRSFWCFLIIHVLITLFLVYGVVSYWFTEAALLGYVVMTCPALISSICRRLHDSGYSLRWLFMGLVPVLGTLFLLYGLLKKGEPYHNRFGPNPRVWKH
jgi:uncharacterized membrane protein YhaH (DUF805 family)